MSSTGRYLYGIIRAEERADFALTGLDDIDGPAKVQVLPVGRLAVLLSPYPADRKVPPLRKNLMAHNRVIKEVLSVTTILPLGLGQIASSEAEVVAALTAVEDDIRGELQRLDGRVEMDLTMRWSVDNLFAYLIEQDGELRALRDQIFAPGRAPSHGEKLELGRFFDQRLQQTRQQHQERVTEALEQVTDEVSLLPVTDEKAILRLALLVPRAGIGELEAKVSAIAAEYPQEYAFDYVGPFAPFHFTSVDIRMAS